MPLSLLTALRDAPLAFVDTETTGVSADLGHRVIELGIVRVEGGRKVAEYQQLINPHRRIGAGVVHLTGITQEMVTDQPRFMDQWPAAAELMRGAAIVGHNVSFDLSFLREEFRRGGVDINLLFQGAHFFDTVRIARRRFGRGGNGLQLLSRRLGIEPVTAHRALADAVTTSLVFERMLEPIGGWGLSLADAMLAQGGAMSLPPPSERRPLLPLELEEALEARRPVMMEYLDARQQRTHRIIEPLYLRRVAGEMVMVAWCRLRMAQRTFKLERIVQLTRMEDAATPPTDACDDPAEDD